MKYLALLALLCPLALGARPLVVPTLPESEFADTESATNILIDVGAQWSKLDIRLSANATASNNVQIAFGVDANENGALEPIETEVVLGWDSGAWFLTDERADWTRRWPKEAGIRELACSLRIVNRKPRALKVADDEVLFDDEVPDIPRSIFNPAWNLLRITSRGRALRDELIALKLTRFGMALEVK